MTHYNGYTLSAPYDLEGGFRAMIVKRLPKGRPVGSLPQRQAVRSSAAVVGVSEWSHRVAYLSYKSVDERHMLIYSAIAKNPGRTIAGVKRLTGLSKDSVKSALTNMDKYGLLLYEDDFGGLYPFEVIEAVPV